MEATRAALVDAAESLFAEQGLDASLDAICERAGFTRGAFYVHFADRDALLVAVMAKVGASFLAQMFAAAEATPARARESAEPTREGHAPASALTHAGELGSAAARFVAAIESGGYPLMGPSGASSNPRHRTAVAGTSRIQFHQLLDACARSSKVRAQYRGLVEASIAHIASLAERDRSAGLLRPDVDSAALGNAMLATIIGAQTMAELGVPVDTAALAKTLLSLLAPARSRPV